MRNAQKGFTIVEMMIAVGISAIIIAGVFGILTVSNKQLEVIHARMSLQEGPREALFKMAQEIRQTSPDSSKLHTLSTPDANGIERASTIDFIVPVPAPDAASLIDTNFDPKWACQIQYRLDETTHQILRVATILPTEEVPTPPPPKTAILANEVMSLEFSRKTSAPGLITITATTQRELADGRKIPDEPIVMITKAEARNP
jgi:prepilin-type N-terminal cleavage/methylation domain-containing protein